jgi:hypothetical protein
MSLPVGADIESICGKCGDVWHVVVAKVGQQVVKVQCKQCLGTHRYKGGPAEIAARKASGPSTPRARKASGGVAPAPKAATPLVEANAKPVRPYKPADAYAAGDRISHPTFGQGVVEGSPGPGKIHVFFPTGRRILAVTKAASTIGAPTPRDG